MSFSAGDFPADPYPGARPDYSYVQYRDTVLPLQHDRSCPSGWRLADADQDLDDWLRGRDLTDLASRVPVLAYGSNACPGKISWLREQLDLPGPVLALRAHCAGISAVWATGRRERDGQRPATIAASPDTTETHFVWLAERAQLPALDACEARGDRYSLAWLRSGSVTLDSGTRLDEVLAYVSASPVRQPLLVDDEMVPCSLMPQVEARLLRGVAADSDGLDFSVAHGDVQPGMWPRQVFVYGTLQPGEGAWSLVQPYLSGQPEQAAVPGELFDTGLGYPALRPSDDPDISVPGWILPLDDPLATLPVLDDYEGEQYRRVRLATTDGRLCWAYVYTEQTAGLPSLPRGWSGAHSVS